MKKIDEPKKEASIALKKAQTHLSKVQKMIDENVYCIEILEQILAVNGLLKSASEKILKNHMRTCFIHKMQTDDVQERENIIKEVLNVMNLSGKAK